jgi:Na+-transporting NADH:ubiquinone oxidoreductase subunit C
MNTNSNKYIFIYSSVMVILVAAALSFTAISLQPLQEKNIEIEKKQNILASVGEQATVENAQELYQKYIIASYCVNTKGEKIDGVDAFNVNMAQEIIKPADQRNLPVYECLIDGNNYYIIPLRGKGLWGPIWGYFALDKDMNTIHGAVFDHKGETPGLGAEINKEWFQAPFKGKTIFDENGNFVSITVHKGGKGAALVAGDTNHGVDAISGGTITSKGLQAMIKDCLEPYVTFFKSHKN